MASRPKTLIIRHGNETYYVNESGHIRRLHPDGSVMVYGSDAWVFRGFAFSNLSRRPTMTCAEVFQNADTIRERGARLWGFDVDHGTARQWGQPRTRWAYITDKYNWRENRWEA